MLIAKGRIFRWRSFLICAFVLVIVLIYLAHFCHQTDLSTVIGEREHVINSPHTEVNPIRKRADEYRYFRTTTYLENTTYLTESTQIAVRFRQKKLTINSYSMNKPCHYCMDLDFLFLINPTGLCAIKSQSHIQLLIFIHSSPRSRQARNAIRNTWGKICRRAESVVRCAFMIGEADETSVNDDVVAEARRHKDIVQIDVFDSYKNLTYKTVMALNWVVQYCPNTRYILKTDEDMFINTALISLMLLNTPATRFYGGFCRKVSLPARNIESKWYVTHEEYAGTIYPEMCIGAAYIISYDLIKRLTVTLKNFPYLSIEDVYIALVTNSLDVKPMNIAGFYNDVPRGTPCQYRHLVMTAHELEPSKIMRLWKWINKCNVPIRPDKNYYSVIPLDDVKHVTA